MINKMRSAATVHEVDFTFQIMAQLVMCGAKIIPEKYWKKIAGWYVNNSWEGENVGKFKYHENHDRSGPHDTWQYDTFGTLADKGEVWIIPLDELLCLYHNTPDASDFVSLDRLSFQGTEEELDAAITELLFVSLAKDER